MQIREPVNILLVDDQPGKLLSYETILSELGENLIKVTSGREALECLLKTEIAVVLVDVCMPDLDGYELTTMIRNHPRFQKTAIILVSGVLTEDVDRLKGYVSGAVDYVSVPIVPEILRAKVSVFADLYRKTEALQQLNQELEKRVQQRTAALSDTAEKLAQAYEASHYLASIVESSHDAVIGQSLTGIIRTWNGGAERLYGYKAEEILGRNVRQLTPPDLQNEEAVILEKVARGEGVEHFETVRVRKDGSRVEVSLTISAIRNERGELIGASQVARDITEKKRTAQLMLQAHKLESLGVLAGGVAHDFNNLLVGILGNSSLALDLLPGDSAARPLIESVVAAGESAAGLTQQMLAYAGRASFVLKNIDLSDHVRQAIPLAQAAVSRAVEFRQELAEDLPPVSADISQVQQIVMNLAINAAESIPAGRRGKLVIITRLQNVDEEFLRANAGTLIGDLAPGPYSTLEVHDNGAGMDEKTKARIFEPFFTTKFTGRGLGLAAVLGIVKGHGGGIQVMTTPGEGTVFRVLFPAVSGSVKQRQPSRREATLVASGGGTVLVIDDEMIVRRVAQHVLQECGYQVLLADDGQSGVELYRRNAAAVQCVVLDATMPRMSGEDTLAALQSVRADVSVILSSGFSESEIQRRFEGRRVAGFIQKPYRSAALLEKVTAVMSQTPVRVART